MARLDRLQKQLKIKNQDEEVAIKKLLRDGRRDKAMSLLKLKKLRETQVSNCQQTYFKLEEMVMNIESAQMNQEVLKSLQIGNESLKKLNSFMSIEAVEALLDDTQEAIDQQREIDALLAGNVHENFEDELEKELAELIGENTASTASTATKVTKTEIDPLDELAALSAPKTVVKVPQTNDAINIDDELASLNAPNHRIVISEDIDAELAE
jgi:charged multivesicular body protein 6